jgi:hypothetical protein
VSPLDPYGKNLRVALREAVYAVLNDDPYMPGAPTFAYRPTRRPVDLPSVTFFDTGTRADDVVPLWDRDIQFDIFTSSDLDLAEAIAHRVVELLDHQPVDLPGDEGRVDFIMLTTDRDVSVEDGNLVRKTLVFRLLAYDYSGPPPFGEEAP